MYAASTGHPSTILGIPGMNKVTSLPCPGSNFPAPCAHKWSVQCDTRYALLCALRRNTSPSAWSRPQPRLLFPNPSWRRRVASPQSPTVLHRSCWKSRRCFRWICLAARPWISATPACPKKPDDSPVALPNGSLFHRSSWLARPSSPQPQCLPAQTTPPCYASIVAVPAKCSLTSARSFAPATVQTPTTQKPAIYAPLSYSVSPRWLLQPSSPLSSSLEVYWRTPGICDIGP